MIHILILALSIWLAILIVCALIVIVLYKFGVVDMLFSTKKYSSNVLLSRECGIGYENNGLVDAENIINDWTISNSCLKDNVLLRRECGIN